jgi:hypothetical protein
MHLSSPPYVPHVLPISVFLTWSPEWYLVRSTEHKDQGTYTYISKTNHVLAIYIYCCSYSVVTTCGICNVISHTESFVFLHGTFQSMCAVPIWMVSAVPWFSAFPLHLSCIITVALVLHSQVLELCFEWFNSFHVQRRKGNFLHCHRHQLASRYYLNVTCWRTGLLGYRNLCLALCWCSKYRHDKTVDQRHARDVATSLTSVF